MRDGREAITLPDADQEAVTGPPVDDGERISPIEAADAIHVWPAVQDFERVSLQFPVRAPEIRRFDGAEQFIGSDKLAADGIRRKPLVLEELPDPLVIGNLELPLLFGGPSPASAVWDPPHRIEVWRTREPGLQPERRAVAPVRFRSFPPSFAGLMEAPLGDGDEPRPPGDGKEQQGPEPVTTHRSSVPRVRPEIPSRSVDRRAIGERVRSGWGPSRSAEKVEISLIRIGNPSSSNPGPDRQRSADRSIQAERADTTRWWKMQEMPKGRLPGKLNSKVHPAIDPHGLHYEVLAIEQTIETLVLQVSSLVVPLRISDPLIVDGPVEIRGSGDDAAGSFKAPWTLEMERPFTDGPARHFADASEVKDAHGSGSARDRER